MSWSVYLSKRKMMTDEIDVGNHTYNVYPMYLRAMGNGLTDLLNGKKCKDVIPILQKGIASMEDDPDTYKKMNPPNGWGTYETALEFLKEILNACETHKDYKIEIC